MIQIDSSLRQLLDVYCLYYSSPPLVGLPGEDGGSFPWPVDAVSCVLCMNCNSIVAVSLLHCLPVLIQPLLQASSGFFNVYLVAVQARDLIDTSLGFDHECCWFEFYQGVVEGVPRSEHNSDV